MESERKTCQLYPEELKILKNVMRLREQQTLATTTTMSETGLSYSLASLALSYYIVADCRLVSILGLNRHACKLN